MPVIQCKEKEGQADACKKEIVYMGENVTTLFSGAGGSAALKDNTKNNGNTGSPKERHLTLKCIDGHINNYKITQ